MICKIVDSTGLYSFQFPKSKFPKLWLTDGDEIKIDTIDYIFKFEPLSTTAVGTYTAYLKIYDIYDVLIKTITVNSDVTNTDNSLSILPKQLVLSNTDVETGFSSNTTTLTYSNLTSDITFNNTRFNDFELSVDNVNFYTDAIPIKDLNGATSKTLYVRRNRNSLGNLLFDLTLTNGSVSDTMTISSFNKSTSLEDYQDLTLGTGWTNDGGNYGNLQAMKNNAGTVFIRGTVSGTSVANTIATLSVIYYPANELRFPISANGSFAEIYIDTSGNIKSTSALTTLHINISYTVI